MDAGAKESICAADALLGGRQHAVGTLRIGFMLYALV
jgi:hypothetical protein